MGNDCCRRIAFIKEKVGGKVDISVCTSSLPNEVYEKFLEKSQVIFELRPIFLAFESLEINRNHLNHINYENDFSGIQNEAIDGFKRISFATNRISNLLGSASSYLGVSEKKLSFFFGKGSDELNKWDDYRKNLHKNNFSYRFAYSLRNYSQHYGLPLSKVHIHRKNLTTEHPSQEVSVLLHKQHLLNSGFDWGRLQNDIENQDEQIDATLLCNEYVEILKDLHIFFLNQIDSRISDAENFIDKLLIAHKVPDDVTPMIFVYENEQEIDAQPKGQEYFPIDEIGIIRNQKIKKSPVIKTLG